MVLVVDGGRVVVVVFGGRVVVVVGGGGATGKGRVVVGPEGRVVVGVEPLGRVVPGALPTVAVVPSAVVSTTGATVVTPSGGADVASPSTVVLEPAATGTVPPGSQLPLRELSGIPVDDHNRSVDVRGIAGCPLVPDHHPLRALFPDDRHHLPFEDLAQRWIAGAGVCRSGPAHRPRRLVAGKPDCPGGHRDQPTEDQESTKTQNQPSGIEKIETGQPPAWAPVAIVRRKAPGDLLGQLIGREPFRLGGWF